jgi:basic membrane lipoprotein Med (substrate-binding protein (PBP1-ABC) superfamily)/DNA-binding SARP family transcriptional activator/class 3 adenylate cyclase
MSGTWPHGRGGSSSQSETRETQSGKRILLPKGPEAQASIVDGSDKAFGDRGEIKTFLIADIRGYTAFTEEQGDVAAGRLAARFAAITRQVAEGHSGLLLELRGGEALVVFDSARQAIRAAVDLQERFVDETVSDPTLPLAVGIGLDAGEGVPVEGGYRGSGLNRASRLCALAGPGEILASGEIVHLAGKVPGVTFTARGDLSVRGTVASLHLMAVSSETKPAPALMAPFAPSRSGTSGTSGGSLRFCILGPLEVLGPDRGTGSGAADGRLAELGPPKQRAMLAILLMHVGEIVPVERLIDLVWGEHPPRTAGHSIQIYASELRKTLEPAAGHPLILTRPPGYLLEAEPDSIDARQFERLVEEGARSLASGDPAAAAAALHTALRLWRGQPLADFAYEEFAQADIRRLQDLRLTAIEELSQAQLAVGGAPEVLPMLETAIREDPLRERLREVQMLALYRSGRHPDALRAYQDFRQLLADELGLDPSPAVQQLQERILLHDPSLGPETSQPERQTAVRNPYKGLRPFSEEDAEDFFGRGALVHQLLEGMSKGVPLLATVGPSGSGKSSAVAAGLIPALRSGAIDGSEDWVIAQMQPGTNPLGELAAALLRAFAPKHSSLEERLNEEEGSLIAAAVQALPVGGRIVLVIDQFEELFTMDDERSRERFLGELVSAVEAPRILAHAVICLRGDFYDRPLMHPELARVFVPGVVNVLPMTPAEIEEAVVEPAKRAGMEVEPALLAEMTADTVHQPGALPLLQYALTELFDRRTGSVLTLGDYRAVGGLPGALSRRAEELYGGLDEDERQTTRQVLLRLVNLGQGARDSRRRAPLPELTALGVDPVALSDVLEKFGRHRLVSFDRDPLTGDATVEVAHEALLWEWERLAAWVDVYRSDLRRRDTLLYAVDEWEASGRNPDYLLGGGRLDEFETWSRDTQLRLTERERRFLEAAAERSEADRAREESRQTQQRRLERRARRRLVGLVAAIAMLVAAATYGALLWLGNRPPDVALLIEPESTYQGLFAQGIDRAISELGLDAEKVPVLPELMDQELRRLSEEGVGLILAQSNLVDVNAVAADFPDTRYVAFDFTGRPRPSLPNVSYVSFAANEGSFLVGAAAALESRTGRIGFIGGLDIPVIHEFQAGYEAGARAVDPSIEVLTTYLTPYFDFSGFGSPTLGLQAAERLYRHGADVIYHAAGESGRGVFQAAAEIRGRHVWAIGVDVDQYQEVAAMDPKDAPPELHIEAWPSHMLTSMVKRVDVAVYEVLRDYSRGIFTSGVREFGLAQGGVDIAYSGGFIDDIRPQIEDLRAKIIARVVFVPSKPAKA